MLFFFFQGPNDNNNNKHEKKNLTTLTKKTFLQNSDALPTLCFFSSIIDGERECLCFGKGGKHRSTRTLREREASSLEEEEKNKLVCGLGRWWWWWLLLFLFFLLFFLRGSKKSFSFLLPSRTERERGMEFFIAPPLLPFSFFLARRDSS